MVPLVSDLNFKVTLKPIRSAFIPRVPARSRPIHLTRAQAIYLDRQIFLIRRVRVRARVPLLHLLLVARLGELLLEVQGLVAVDALVGDGVAHAAVRIIVLIWP